MGRIPLSPASSFDEMGQLEPFQDVAVGSSTSHPQPCVLLDESHQGFGSDYSTCHGTLSAKGLPPYTSNPQELPPPVSHSFTRRWRRDRSTDDRGPRSDITGRMHPPAESMVPREGRQAT